MPQCSYTLICKSAYMKKDHTPALTLTKDVTQHPLADLRSIPVLCYRDDDDAMNVSSCHVTEQTAQMDTLGNVMLEKKIQ